MCVHKPVYKIHPQEDWDAACRSGRFQGSKDDIRDGFIHLSTSEQLRGTLDRHFAEQTGLALIAFDPSQIETGLKWEPSRGGALFPHFYGALDPKLALSVAPLLLDVDGRHIIPESAT